MLSYDISYEIARYIHKSDISKTYKLILSLNLDKEFLEQELRLFHVIRKIDRAGKYDE